MKYRLRASMITAVLSTALAGAAGAHAESPSTPHSGSWYGLSGYGAIFGNQMYDGPFLGVGFRSRRDAFGLDAGASLFTCVSARRLSTLECSDSDLIPIGLGVNLEGLYFLHAADRGLYLGPGLGWGWSEVTNDFGSSSTRWRSFGFHGKLTLGYERPLQKRDHLLVQFDAVLPFYRTIGQPLSNSRVNPSAA